MRGEISRESVCSMYTKNSIQVKIWNTIDASFKENWVYD